MTATPPTEAIPVHIYMALDRSGSMQRIRSDVIGGYNRFLQEQKAKPGKCRFTLVQFDDVAPFELVHGAIQLADAPELNDETFVPRGSTPLFDAEGRLIVLVEERVKLRRSEDLPDEAIVFVTFTDGMENSSRDWTREALADKKKEHEGDWAFIYLGVGHDGYAQAGRIGTQVVNTSSQTGDAAGVAASMDWYVGEVDNARERAGRGLKTNSGQTRSAQTAEEERRRQAAAAASDT